MTAFALQENGKDALRRMMAIRAFEDALAGRQDHGFQLLSSGEEAVAVGLTSALSPRDQLLTGGRSIGAALARGVAPQRLMAELLGKVDGPNQGRGGRGHLADPANGFFGAHAVVGGNISIAAGVALARQMEGAGDMVCVLFGDGACGAGALHETLNMAALWKLPLLLVCSNNQYSVSTERANGLAPEKLSDIAASFGLWSRTIDGTDVGTVSLNMKEAVAHVRTTGPAFVECLSIRLRSHSTTARETRSREALALLETQDPILRQILHLRLSEAEITVLWTEAEAFAQEALAFAEASPYPSVSELLNHVG